MKGLIAFALCALISQGSAYSPAETCAIVQTNTFIADPLDCTGYYYCVDGAVSFQGNCPKDQSYNSYTGSCDYTSNVQCNFGTSVCQNVASPTYKSDPSSCNSYIYCDGRGKTSYNSCPPGQNFNLDTISCVWSAPNTCSGSPCELVPNNKFVGTGTTTDVQGNIVYTSQTCYNGIGSTNTCPVGYLYNSIEGQCEFDNTPGQEIPDCTKAVNNFAASPTNCNSYYYCKAEATTPVTYTTTQLWCPQRFHFNAAKGNCVYAWEYVPAGANVNCDRCGGWTSGYFVDADKTCTSYLFCQAGETGKGSTNKQNPKGTCSNKNFPYFSESAQACVGTKPTSAYCSA